MTRRAGSGSGLIVVNRTRAVPAGSEQSTWSYNALPAEVPYPMTDSSTTQERRLSLIWMPGLFLNRAFQILSDSPWVVSPRTSLRSPAVRGVSEPSKERCQRVCRWAFQPSSSAPQPSSSPLLELPWQPLPFLLLLRPTCCQEPGDNQRSLPVRGPIERRVLPASPCSSTVWRVRGSRYRRIW